MKLLLGLGNVGDKYTDTRHNAGFLAVDAFAKENNADDFKVESKFNAFITECNIKGEKIIIAKPTTYMNRSGSAISSIMKYYKIDIEDILVVYDDKDMEFGKIRYRDTGRSGGHNGIKDIIHHLGTEDFKRIKIGVGDKDHPAFDDASDFVLGRFSKDEIERLEDEIIPEVLEMIMDKQFS